MSRARFVPTAVALTAALLVAGYGVAPARAADPGPAAGRPVIDAGPARAAWDKQALDDGTRLIVEFRKATPVALRRSTIAAAGIERVADLPSVQAEVVRVSADRSAQAMAALEADPAVLRVSVDHHRYRDADPRGEPGWSELWGLNNTGQDLFGGTQPGGTPDVDIDGLQALGVTTGDPNLVVAVIDDGVDFSHPDLAARAWTNPGESGAGKETNGIDDDGNGYIDDVHGWDFCHNDNTVHDFNDDFHGTHVAGTIAASLDGQGVVGVAPSVSIMALKFINGTQTILGSRDCGLDSQAIAAIAYAKSFGVHISNNSWGGPGTSPALYDAIKTSGMLFVVAAGNDGVDLDDPNTPPEVPASFDLPNILSVAALDDNGGLADFSNFGTTSVDIAAPGVDILSAQAADPGHANPWWGWLSGTSMATPHVTGSAALVVSMLPALAADPVALKARLLASGKPMPLTAGSTVTGKVVDAFRALDATAPTSPAPNNHGFALGSTLGKTTAVARIGWPAGADNLTGVPAYGVRVQTNAGPPSPVTSSTASRTVDRVVTFGASYGFQVRARDGAGNWGPFVNGPVVTPRLYQESSSLIAYKGGWAHSSSKTASGGHTRSSSHAGAAATFHFNGRAFAVAMSKGPTRGSIKLYVDGRFAATISLHRSTTASRTLVATGWWPVSGAHTVKLVVVGTAHHARVDIDAFAVMR